MMVVLVVTGARTELTGMTALDVLMIALVVKDPAWTSPPSGFPPSTSLLDKEEDITVPSEVEEEE